MLPDEGAMPPAIVVATAREILAKNGFAVAADTENALSGHGHTLLAEDPYSVIFLAAYDTWQDLDCAWSDIQGELVSLFSKRLSRSAPKAWDGYLVLTCTTAAPDRAAIDAIERDTTRVRKIVATATTLRTTKDIERILDAFLPLDAAGVDLDVDVPDVLASLPELLQSEVPAAATKAVVDAFRLMEPPLEKLHSLGTKL